MEKEIWKDIPGYKKMYQISNFGKIQSLDRTVIINTLNKRGNYKRDVKGRLLKQHLSNSGYLWSVLSKKGNTQGGLFVHRLVLLAFKGKSKLECNHKNGNKLDNRLLNLEYVTASENQIHAVKTNLKKDNIPVQQFTKNNILINSFFSISEASRKTGILPACICLCVNNKLKTSGGFLWRKTK